MTHRHGTDQFNEILATLKNLKPETSSEIFDVTAKINLYRGIEVNLKDGFTIGNRKEAAFNLIGAFAFLIDENTEFKGYFEIEKGDSDGHYFLTAPAETFLREQTFSKDCFLLVKAESKDGSSELLKKSNGNEDGAEPDGSGFSENFFDGIISFFTSGQGNTRKRPK